MPKPYKTVKPKLDAEKTGSAKTTWVPRTKAEAEMERKYRSWSRSARMDEGVRLVMDDGISVAQAARQVGVTRSRLSNRVQEARKDAEDREQRIAAARSDLAGEPKPILSAERRVPSFREFNRIYFGNEVCPDCGVHHETPEFHGQAMDLLEDYSKRMKLFNFAPYHAKSTTCTFKSTLYELVRNPSSRTAIISAGSDLAQAMLYQIKEHLTDHDLYIGAERDLIEDWGPFHNPGNWGKEAIYIYGRSGAQKDPSVSTYGFGTKIYGRRFDRMIFDDVADLENQNTPESINKMYRKIWQEYVNRVGKTGQLIFVGTRVAPGDIYSLLDDVDGMNVLRFPCIIDEETGQTLWPEHFPIKSALEQRAAMSIEQFQLVYQNVDTPGFGASFPPDVLERAHDPERFAGHYDDQWALVIGLDPAGAGAQAGYTAMVLLAVDLVTGRRYLVDLVNQKQLKAPQTMQQIYDWVERYPVRELRVEVNGLQSQIYQYSEDLNAKLVSRGVRLVPHMTHKGNKWDPQFGVEAMSSLFHNGMISTPWQDLATREKFKKLEEQLVQFPMGKVTDLVMAMWFAELGCRELVQRQALPSYDPRMRLPARIRNKRRVVNFGDRSYRPPTPEEENYGGFHGQRPTAQRPTFVNVAPGVGLTG